MSTEPCLNIQVKLKRLIGCDWIMSVLLALDFSFALGFRFEQTLLKILMELHGIFCLNSKQIIMFYLKFTSGVHR